MSLHSLHTFNSEKEACNFIVKLICSKAKACIHEKNSFVLSLAGGRSPKLIYDLLKEQHEDWQHWHLIYGDERAVELDDADRNSLLVCQTLAHHTAIPNENHHLVIKQNTLEATQQQYLQSIQHLLPADFVLLGIGEDGHVASLFPENLQKNIQNNEQVLAINNASKPPSNRITLNYHTFNQSPNICLLGFGEAKKTAIAQWHVNNALPFNHIHGTEHTWLISHL